MVDVEFVIDVVFGTSLRPIVEMKTCTALLCEYVVSMFNSSTRRFEALRDTLPFSARIQIPKVGYLNISIFWTSFQ